MLRKRRKKVDSHIYETCEWTCHDCSAKATVENDKDDSVVEDADLLIKKYMENKKILIEKENMKIGSLQCKREFWKCHQSQYELRLNVDEQQD